MSTVFDVAIIGGGFAGLMVAANLGLREGPEYRHARPKIYWADASGHDFGTAYRTREGHHRLNVRADKMSAWVGGGADFYRWAQAHYPDQYAAGDYVPRMVYTQYLSSIRLKLAAALGDHLVLDHRAITGAVRRGDLWQVSGPDGVAVTARHVVLATGNPPIADPAWPDAPRFIKNAWEWRLAGGTLPADCPHVVVIGAGLTAVDMILSLRADGYGGPITAVSPHGRFPAPHSDPVADFEDIRFMVAKMLLRPSARGYLECLREYVAKADGDWRAVIGAVRDHTVMLWERLPEHEKARFMRHLWSRWNVHRHRMAGDVAQALAADGQLRLVAGRARVMDNGDVLITARGSGNVERISGAAVINCTGPHYRRMVADNPLLLALLQNGYVQPGPLGLGIATPDMAGLHALGTALLGERLETTAVPDLRQQAAAIATRIAATLPS